MIRNSFSVVMSVYHRDNADYFDRALQSITENQTLLPTEIVLVCDGPLGEKLDSVIDKYQGEYPIFNIIRLPENKGLGNALKVAVENSNNEIIARMDSDDVSIPNRFEQQLKYFADHNDIDIVGGDITEFVNNEENIVGKRQVPVENNDIRKYMKTRCAMNHVTVMFRKEAIQSAGGYLDWFWNEDYYLWIRLCLKGAVFANTGTVLVNVRVGEEMYQRRGGIQYFNSEFGLQKLMLKKGMIGLITFFCNVTKRFIVQLLLPNTIRGWVFKKLARTTQEDRNKWV